jgi:hypothetical protein
MKRFFYNPGKHWSNRNWPGEKLRLPISTLYETVILIFSYVVVTVNAFVADSCLSAFMKIMMTAMVFGSSLMPIFLLVPYFATFLFSVLLRVFMMFSSAILIWLSSDSIC